MLSAPGEDSDRGQHSPRGGHREDGKHTAGPSDAAHAGTQSVSQAETTAPAPAADKRLPILLAMAMFVLVVDTSIMNVSISAVVADLGTDVSAIQSAIALEALV